MQRSDAFDVAELRRELRSMVADLVGWDLAGVGDDEHLLDYVTSSMDVVEGLRRIYDRFGVLIPIRTVMEGAASITTLAAYLHQALRTDPPSEAGQRDEPPTARHTGDDGGRRPEEKRSVPLAPSQQHIAFLVRYSTGSSAAYNESAAIRLEGRLDTDGLVRALGHVCERYEPLRAALSARADTLEIGAVQRPAAEDCPEEGLGERLGELVARPFEPGQTLCRAAVLRLSDDDHVVVLVSHALVADRPILVEMLRDVEDRYSSTCDRSEPEPDPVAGAPVTAFVSQQSTERPESERLAAVNHWKHVFAEGATRVALPSDRPTPLIKSYEGMRAVVTVESDIAARLRTWAGTNATSEAVTVLGAFTCYLHRLTQQDEIVLGVGRTGAAAGRPVVQAQELLPVRSTYFHDQTLADHVRRTHASLVDSSGYGSLSTAEIIQALNLTRDQSRPPLFTVAYGWRDDGACPAPASVRGTFVPTPAGGARYDIELIVASSDVGLELQCDYSSELFDQVTVQRWLRGVLALLSDGLTGAATACGDLAIMPEAERRVLLEEWSCTTAPEWLGETTLRLFAEQVEAAPDRPAIRCRDQQLTYAQLDQRVDAVSHLLRAEGVQRGDRVAILLERSFDLVAAMLAAWRVGAAYVPLDRNLPSKRLEFIVTDADVRMVLTSRALAGRFGDQRVRSVSYIESVGDVAGRSAPVLASDAADDAAYVIYTSGSTGAPKGVEIVHRALANCLLATRHALDFTSEESLLAVTTVAFDISVVELFMPLITGAVLELAEDGVAEHGIRLAERIDASRPTYVQTTPSSCKVLLAAGWRGDGQVRMGLAGENLRRELAEDVLPLVGSLWNLYGPTETTVYATAHRVEPAAGQPVPIGRPLANTSVYIVDRRLRLLPAGATGELCIGGASLARGYWRRDDLTAERFVPSPFDGQRLYRTGDLARFSQSGDVLCLGRVDDQLKVHGIRVEPGEVEAAFREIDGVRDAVVTSVVDAFGDRQLVAHVLADCGVTITPADIRTGLRRSIPEPLIPPHILFCDSFPLTHSGKVDRKALPAPDGRPARAPAESSPPTTPTERTVATIWSALLAVPVDRIQRHDDFLDLGGHSLLMTRLMVEVRERFGVKFTMRELFDARTVATFSELVDRRRRTQAGREHARAATARQSEWARERMGLLMREAELPAHIAPARGLAYEPRGRPKSALVTGATGFLGAYIVAEILQTTDAEVYCLVRPKHGNRGRDRIEAQMRHYNLWHEGDDWQAQWEARVHVVDGDVILPRLGMVGPAYEALARDLDCVIHSAAHVNFIYPYEALKATNVLGVHEIVRFAFHGRVKPVHYLSTAAVWPMGAQYTFGEDESLDHGMLLNLGYDEAKWVAEKCLLHAADRGLPVARYRPGEVGGDSRTGQCVVDHFIVAGLKGFLQFGAFPILDSELDVAPVNYVASALVHLAFRRDPLGRAFHLTNPRRCHMSDALAFLRSVGYRFRELPFDQLRDEMIYRPDFAHSALFPYQAVLEYMDDRSLELPRYDTSGTRRELEGSGIVCPPVDERLLGSYVGYLRGIGFLPDVTGSVRDVASVKV